MLMRRLGFLAIAAFISIGTVIGARSWLHTQLAAREVPVAPPVPITELNRMVLVASGDLPAGQFVHVGLDPALPRGKVVRDDESGSHPS